MSISTSAPLQIKGRPPSAKRFNRRVLGGFLGGTTLVLMIAVGFALRSPDSAGEAPQELYNTTSKTLPDSLSTLPTTYDDVTPERPVLGPPLPGDVGAGFYSGPNEVPTDNPFRYQPPAHEYAPVPGFEPAANNSANAPSPRTSKLFFISHNGGGDSQRNTDQSGGGQIAASQTGPFADPGIAALAAIFGQEGAGLSQGNGDANGNSNSTFEPSGSEIYNPHHMERPASPYQVMAGTIIPASLVTGLNSDLPGQVIAQVTETVFDTPTGKHLLIPQGTRLLGRHDSDIEAGQSRALVVWTRMIRPDGTSLVIESLPSVDLTGQAGLRDRVDRHAGSLFGAAILSTILSVASEIGSDEDDMITEAIRNGGQDTINQAGQKVVTRALSRKPTLRVRPGWRLRVIVNRDLILAPYGE
jgi:type IV secretion system protein VirB10